MRPLHESELVGSMMDPLSNPQSLQDLYTELGVDSSWIMVNASIDTPLRNFDHSTGRIGARVHYSIIWAMLLGLEWE